MGTNAKFLSTIILAILSGSATTLLLSHLQEAVNPFVSSRRIEWGHALSAIGVDFMDSWIIYLVCIIVLGAGVYFIWREIKSDHEREKKIDEDSKILWGKIDNLIEAIKNNKTKI